MAINAKTQADYFKDAQEYFKKLTNTFTIFYRENHTLSNDLGQQIFQDYKELDSIFIDFNNTALQSLNKKEKHTIIYGRRGTGKSSYFTKAFFDLLFNYSKKKIIPLFIDSNLQIDEDLTSYEMIEKDFYINLKFQIIRSLYIIYLVKEYIKKKKNIKIDFSDEENLDGLDIDISNINQIINLDSPFFEKKDEDYLSKQDYINFLNNFRQKIKKQSNNEKKDEGDFESFISFVQKIMKIWKISNFNFFIDDVSEVFIRGNCSKDAKKVFSKFLKKIIEKPDKNFININLALYNINDFDRLFKDADKDPIDHKYLDFICLDFFYPEKYASYHSGKTGSSIRNLYMKDLNSHIEKIIERAVSINNSNINVFNVIFDNYDQNRATILKYLRETTGGAFRALGLILSKALDDVNRKDENKQKIKLENLRLGIVEHYKSKSENKEKKLLSKIIDKKKNDTKTNVFYINDDFKTENYMVEFPDNYRELENIFQMKFINTLEQNFLLNIVSAIKEGPKTINIYAVHPGMAFSTKGWNTSLLKFDGYSPREKTMYVSTKYKKYFIDYFKNLFNYDLQQKSNLLRRIEALLKLKGTPEEVIKAMLVNLEKQSYEDIEKTYVDMNPPDGDEIDKLYPDEYKFDENTTDNDDEDKILYIISDKLKRTQFFDYYKEIIILIFNKNQNGVKKEEIALLLEDFGSGARSRMNYLINFLIKKKILKKSGDKFFLTGDFHN